MAKVIIYKTTSDGQQEPIVVCRLQDNSVICEGDETLISNLQQSGIPNYRSHTPQTLYPQHGQPFLEQLAHAFKTGYLCATQILPE